MCALPYILPEGARRLRRFHVYGGMLVALSAVFTVAVQTLVPTVEGRVRVAVEEALDAKGVTWASVEPSGRSVVLAGSPSGEKERLAALATAREVPLVFRARSELRMPVLTGVPSTRGKGSAVDSSDSALARSGAGAAATDELTAVDDPALASRLPNQVAEADPPTGAATSPAEDAPQAEDDVAEQPRQEVADPIESGTLDPGTSDSSASNSGTSDPRTSAPGAPDLAPVRSDPPRRESCETRVTRVAHERVFFFTPGATTLPEEDRASVREIAQVLSGCREWTVTIVGYAGEDEGEAVWSLSEQRARSVADLLMRGGIDETRIAAVGGRHDQSSGLHERRVELYASGG